MGFEGGGWKGGRWKGEVRKSGGKGEESKLGEERRKVDVEVEQTEETTDA